MKSWKKLLNEEFEAAAPALKDEVRNAPIITAQSDASDIPSGNALAKRKPWIWACGAAATALAVVIALLGILGVFTPKPAFDRFVFSLEINPAVSFVTDKNGVVKSVNALNADADVLLSEESTLQKLKNAPLFEAVVTFTDAAARLGYLDLTKTQNAVRLSSSAETYEELLASAAAGLRNYFMQSGIYAVVVQDVVTAKELSERMGLAGANSLAELSGSLESLSVRYGERVDENAGAETLRQLHETYIIGTQMLEYVRDELLTSIDDIVRNAQLLSQIALCSYNIMLHKDNPFNPLPVDYWTLKKYPNAEYSPEFSELAAEMENLLAEYESAFGVAIGSLSELTAATDVYSSLSGIDFEELFSALTAEDFLASATKFVGMLKNIGHDVTAHEFLLTAPQTAQEYFAQLETTLNALSASRYEKYKEVYDSPRDRISEAEYEEFISEIVREYGSVENFWNKK